MVGLGNGLIPLLAGRFVRRQPGSPPPRVRVAAIAAGLLIASFSALLAGVGHVALALGVFVFSLILLAGLAVRVFNPMIAVSVIGIALGVASLFTVLAVTSGFEVELTRRVARLSGHVLLTKYGLDFHEYEALAAEQEADPRVAMASPFVWGSAALAVDGRDDDQAPAGGDPQPTVVIVKGLDPRHVARSALMLECLAGGDARTALRPADPGRFPGAALGHRLAERIGVTVGDRIVLVAPEALDGTGRALAGPPRRAVFEVTDLLDTGVSELDTAMALVHLTAAQALLFGRARVSGIELELFDPRASRVLAAQLDARLNEGLRVPVYRAGSWEEYSQSTLAVIRQVRAVVSVILGLMVLVAGGSLFSSLLVLVRRKRTQIASLGAMGASPARVFWIFETAGLLTGLCGASAGLLLGALYVTVLSRFRYPLDAAIYPIDHLPVAFSPWDALVPAGMALAVCALASGPLALAASRVRPIEGLRP